MTRSYQTVLFSFIAFILGLFISLGVQAGAPEQVLIRYFCVTPDAIEEISKALEKGDRQAAAKGDEFEAQKQCYLTPGPVPVYVGPSFKNFVIHDGGHRSLWEGYLQSGRPIYFIGPVDGNPT